MGLCQKDCRKQHGGLQEGFLMLYLEKCLVFCIFMKEFHLKAQLKRALKNEQTFKWMALKKSLLL